MLPIPIPAEQFQSISGWNSQIIEPFRRIEHDQLPVGYSLQIRSEVTHPLTMPDPFGVVIREGLDHAPSITHNVNNAKR